MWKIIKAELKYYSFLNMILFISLAMYTLIALLNKQGWEENDLLNSDIWGGIFSMIVYFYLFITWGKRSKYKHIRMYHSLPISISAQSILRIVLTLLPIITITVYMLFVHIILLKTWVEQSISVINQIGLLFIIAFSVMLCKNIWHMEIGKTSYIRTFLLVLLIAVLVFVLMEVFLLFPAIYNAISPIFGRNAFYYSKALFYIIGAVLIFPVHLSYLNRKTYLTE